MATSNAALADIAKTMYIDGCTIEEVALAAKCSSSPGVADYERLSQLLLQSITGVDLQSSISPIETSEHIDLVKFDINKRPRTCSKPCHVYLIDSGNHDNTYKIGYTSNKAQRLQDIKKDYGVPNASMIASLYVGTKDNALEVEGNLHKKFDRERVFTYYGVEWFALNQMQVTSVKEFLSVN